MNRRSFAAVAVVLTLNVQAQKRIYIPEDLQGMDLQADSSRWSFKRSMETDDLIFMWDRGFNIKDSQEVSGPDLEGKPMKFNLANLRDRVQSFYHFFRDTLGFVKGESKADRYKMMVMVNYSLDGTAYGGTYDNFIGALWVAPNRIQDLKMNCMAHELGHCFQAQMMADSISDCWGGTGFFEMTSQWMLWQVNPDWLTDENYHFEAFRKLTHKAYLHMENIYHSPYVIQWWSDLHGRQSIAELYRHGRRGEDPVMTYKRLYSMSQSQFNDEMLRGYQHLVNFDFSHARKETRKYACSFDTELIEGKDGWLVPKDGLEAYGFHAILLDGRVNLQSHVFQLRLKGDQLRYGFVGVTTDDREIYSDVNATIFNVPNGQMLKHLYLIVMGAPERHQQKGMSTFPYSFIVK